MLIIINNFDYSHQQFWRNDKIIKEWELPPNSRPIIGSKLESQFLSTLATLSSSTPSTSTSTNKPQKETQEKQQPQPKMLALPQQTGRSQFALTYDFMNNFLNDQINQQSLQARIGDFSPNIPIYPSVQVIPPQVPLPPLPQQYQSQFQNFPPPPPPPQPLLPAGPPPIPQFHGLAPGFLPNHPLPPFHQPPPPQAILPPPPPPPPPVPPQILPGNGPFAIQQPGISNTGEAIIENLVGGIPFDCRGRPTGHFRDTRFCDIFHACVFGSQRKTYACPIVGERTYYDEITRR